MTYNWLRGLILWVPTAVIGIWEYVRHAFLLPYVSMELGNWLAPVIVLLVTLTLLRPLFGKLEHMQQALQREQVGKAALEEREQLAKELHDGISQSLFLLSVKLDSLDRSRSKEESGRTMEAIRGTIRHVHDSVRQFIASLHEPPVAADTAWLQSAQALADELEDASGTATIVEWDIPDGLFGRKEKVELLAILREATMNIRKHAGAGRASIRAAILNQTGHGETSFRCIVEDDGIGFNREDLTGKGKYGVRMMSERAVSMGWSLRIDKAERSGTIITIEGRCNET
ncbi:sensor histidine kinase [Paenibacillus sp. PAMC21692]|uniref:sensor histidine kinase n=1 Tax=Paenibacillus sp. PAMC21692 TaxID=2762320 RepID=UPI00164E2957|nr:histidine kinase [Paenibacillus sp. PAMC21692]QNK59808.1 sensor histidine kinase [Paenibacillus sp. PAMC21692]